MKILIPRKLKKGDEVRIIAPALCLKVISQENVKTAKKRLENLGLKITLSSNIIECDILSSSSIKSRIEDLHSAFGDKKVKGILTVIGGYNANHLLDYIDYDLIRKNPKVFCGFSDITVLQNAIFKKTGLITYSGPNFANFAMEKHGQYNIEYFNKCLFSSAPFTIKPIKYWSDDKWYINPEKRKLIKNDGLWVINKGEAEGTIIGGNLCTLNLLQGTKYMPIDLS